MILEQHLCSCVDYVSEFDSEGDLLDDVMDSFWKLYALRPVNYILAPIEARGNLLQILINSLFRISICRRKSVMVIEFLGTWYNINDLFAPTYISLLLKMTQR